MQRTSSALRVVPCCAHLDYSATIDKLSGARALSIGCFATFIMLRNGYRSPHTKFVGCITLVYTSQAFYWLLHSVRINLHPDTCEIECIKKQGMLNTKITSKVVCTRRLSRLYWNVAAGHGYDRAARCTGRAEDRTWTRTRTRRGPPRHERSLDATCVSAAKKSRFSSINLSSNTWNYWLDSQRSTDEVSIHRYEELQDDHGVFWLGRARRWRWFLYILCLSVWVHTGICPQAWPLTSTLQANETMLIEA